VTLTLILLALLITYGSWEYWNHRRNLFSIPVRIHVNGTRGKSSVTRLIAAGLRAGHERVVAKTTGTSPRMILEDGREVPIIRIGHANIIEQLMVVRVAARRSAKTLVIECMAVQPHLQRVSEERMIRSTIGVITNARADHLDQMGPEVSDVAEALSGTIPQGGTLFTADAEWFPVFEQNARTRLAATVLADATTVGSEELAGFSYVEHPDNVALALKVCEHFGVGRREALAAMQQANPDPGVLRGYRLRVGVKMLDCYNAFAANDRDSTLMIWRRLGLHDTREHPVMVVINTRGDRLQRSEQFGRMMAEDLPTRHFFLVGEFTHATRDIALRHGLDPERVVDLGRCTAEEAVEAILTRTELHATVLCMGNIKGIGEELVQYIENRSEEWLKAPSGSASS